METKLNVWEFAEQNLVEGIGLVVRCKTKDCGNAWTIRLNPQITLEKNLEIVAIQRFVCGDCTKKLQKLQEVVLVKS